MKVVLTIKYLVEKNTKEKLRKYTKANYRINYDTEPF